MAAAVAAAPHRWNFSTQSSKIRALTVWSDAGAGGPAKLFVILEHLLMDK
jgi:hypothetical protein